MEREHVLAKMDNDVDVLTVRALQAEAAGMSSGPGLLQCATFIERMVALERTPPDVLFISKQHLGRVRVRQEGPFFGVTRGRRT